MSDLFNKDSLVEDKASGIFREADPVTLLALAIAIRYLVFVIMVNTPVPAGVFAPSVVLGGLIGRFLAGTPL